MTTSHISRDKVPFPYSGDDVLADAYQRGWNHGHGVACHNVPDLGAKLFLDGMGRVTVDAENVREVHQELCHAAADNSRCYSPFEFTAHEFNSHDLETDNIDASECWEAFEAGTSDAIAADLEGYTDEDYGVETDESEDES